MHPFTRINVTGLDYRGISTAECPCGCRVFYMVGWFTDDYELGGYLTTGLCADCGALLTLCTPLDLVEGLWQ